MSSAPTPQPVEVTQESLQIAEQQLYGETNQYISSADDTPGSFGIFTMTNVMRVIFISHADILDTDDTNTSAHIVRLPEYAGLMSRALEDIDALKDETDFLREQTMKDLNNAREQLHDPAAGGRNILNIGFLAFQNVLLRPLDMHVPNRTRRLHAADLGKYAANPFGEAWRHRHNFLYDVMASGELTKSEAYYIASRGLFTDDYIDAKKIFDFLASGKQDGRLLYLVARIGLAGYARNLMPLMYVDSAGQNGVNSPLKTIRDSFIEKSFAILEAHPKYLTEMQRHMQVYASEDVWTHVLAGSNGGGAHHIPSLGSSTELVGSTEQLEVGSYNGERVLLPVARRIIRKPNGDKKSDVVTAFFPSEWTSNDVKDAVLRPSRVLSEVYAKDGTVAQIVQSRGVPIRRILLPFDADCESSQLITAFPAVSVPEPMRKRLTAAG